MAWFSPQPLLLPGSIALNAEFLRDKPAVIDGEHLVSWSEFGSGTARIGNALLDAGLAHGDAVVVLMKNSYEMVEALFGIVRAGLVCVPLNVSISDEAVAGMIANAGARAVIGSDEHVERIEALKGRIAGQGRSAIGSRFIGLDAGRNPNLDDWLDYRAIRDAASAALPDIRIAPDDVCNIIYSSGTTGLPKGIVHDHACREAWGSDMAVALRYHSGSRTLCNLGLFSNISWVAMLATLFSGGTLVVERRFTPEACLEIIESRRITHTAMVPLQFQKLLACERFDDYDLSSLDAYMCCGSPLQAEIKRQVIERMPGDFIELYGLTEGLVTTLGPEDMGEKADSVGRPCPGQRLAIIDSDDRVLPAGEVGEIVGHCRFLMAGYHDNDAANEEATWIHPSGVRWLRTGDIGKLDEDGFLYLVDRKKDMIISGGQNVYPADIEAVMLQHDAVSELAVIGVASDRWGETPLAVVVRSAGNDTDSDALTAWANGRLGKQQRIADTVYVDELPRNPNGKILKRELRKQFAGHKY